MKKFLLALTIGILLLGSCQSKTEQTNNSNAVDTSAVQTIREAYEYGLPLLLIEITKRQSSNGAEPISTATNTFFHLSTFPDASFKNVVRANADTYYSSAFLDLTKEPIVLTVPDTKGRYYMMPMLDAYSNVFASPGSRTTGNKAGTFLITGPNWNGEVPTDMKQIKAPTNIVWIIGRTQVNSKEDGAKIVIPLQKQYTLTPLSAYGKPYTSPVAQADSTAPKGRPNDIVQNMSIEEYFNLMCQLMVTNPPSEKDKVAIDKFATVGIKPGVTFDLSKFTPEQQAAIKKIPEEYLNGLHKAWSTSRKNVNGWGVADTTIGNYGINYNNRAIVAFEGLGANISADAIYQSCAVDADGKPLNGQNKYVLHFNKGEVPPVKAFWSLTMYGPDGFMIANPINRNSIGDRSNLKTNADGSTDIYIQHTSPGKDKESNWLPAPAGDFNILLRAYWPEENMLQGKWLPPTIQKQ